MNPSYVLTGNAAGIGPILTDVANGIGSAVSVRVLLTANYTLADPRPVGFPTKPGLTGGPNPEYTGEVLVAGTIMSFLACEANALVSAGAGTLA